jgi:ribosomal protein L11 methyltransferase
METNYLEYRIYAEPERFGEITALLDSDAINGFIEEADHIKVYCRESESNRNKLNKSLKILADRYKVRFECSDIAAKNWNEEWEKNYHPVVIDDKCIILAPFHEPDSRYPLNIIINPSNSFGTGHHESTYSILSLMLKEDFKGKTVFDLGCGTGILGIAASLMGAKKVFAVDNYPACVDNSMKNAALNNCQNITASIFDAEELGKIEVKYDVVLANITRNVILRFASVVEKLLNENGTFMASGFLTEDASKIINKADKGGLTLDKKLDYRGWSALKFKLK